MSKVKINLGLRSYDILIEQNLLESIPKDLLEYEKGNQAIIISNEKVYTLYGEKLLKSLQRNGFQVFNYIIPEGEIFVIGDNRGPGASNDSRSFGSISLESIKGKAVFRIFPFDKVGSLK